ncbi:MAG: MBL fold metallo-hydrolase [Clostridia bacterium]|nr:MBL fold metallo-hydrolase [Clostridia bacterium]
MKKQRAKKIATWIIVPLMAAIFVFDIITVALGNRYARRVQVGEEAQTPKASDDRIHFLNTANSDCILLESNGKFALIDAGEGDHNPRRKTAYQGYEQRVVDYIKQTCAAPDGKIRLEFVLGTHYHYDHIGGFHALLTDPEIEIGKAYFKPFEAFVFHEFELEKWGLKGLYDQILADLAARSIPLEQTLPDVPFAFGDFTLRFLNTVTPAQLRDQGGNAASVGVLVKKGARSAFLAADFTHSCKLEQLYAREIGQVDLLKAGHHGYFGSSSIAFLRSLRPKLIIVPNQQGKIYPNVKWNFTFAANAPYFATFDYNGIIASFTDAGEIVLTHDLHRAS